MNRDKGCPVCVDATCVDCVALDLHVEVIADNTGTWCGNALRFTSVAEAREYATDLMMRWMLVRDWRIIDGAGKVYESFAGTP